MSPVRIGVVGVGALALRGIIPHLTQDDVRDRVVVHALCDPVIDRAQATAERYGVARAYANIDALLADADVDAVTVASPIGLHYEHCRAGQGSVTDRLRLILHGGGRLCRVRPEGPR